MSEPTKYDRKRVDQRVLEAADTWQRCQCVELGAEDNLPIQCEHADTLAQAVVSRRKLLAVWGKLYGPGTLKL